MKKIISVLSATFLLTSLFYHESSAQAITKASKVSGESKQKESIYGDFDFILQTIEGKRVRLRDQAGKVVLVNIWAPWCGPCSAETPGFVKVYDQFKNKGFEIISIAANTDPDEVKTFVAKYGITWPVGISDDIAAHYRTTAIPDNYLFASNGKLIKHFVGFTREEDLTPPIKEALKKSSSRLTESQ